MARVMWHCVELCVQSLVYAFERVEEVTLAVEMIDLAVNSFCCSLGMKNRASLGLPCYLQLPKDPPEKFAKVTSVH